ncbi:NrtA/SsuA/CpmA family ABC transporter substrate-binding protein [uncultured Thiodictyon sp.]|uniref:ABC transporter substrate-binding protein n=1 Tax=uncultured Thiodictyon sp. TaxID=1846217 RepID=UPI0025E7CFEC|nr:NrtA/SsuA/CpmA family ABC transporter substrate-binding protein [uncultured Thiodictyon sp.]
MTSAQQRIVIIAASAVAASIAIVAVWLSRPPPPAPEPLTIAVSNSFIGVPLWVADQQGFFAAEGLTVTLTRWPTGKLAVETMLRGEAQVATVAETPLVFAALAGKPLRVIATYAGSGEHAIVARADRGISRVADLRGRRVGVIAGTSAQYFLHVMLIDQGLSETDITLVDLPAKEQAAALAAGRVEAVATFAPFTAQCRRALGETARTFPMGLRYRGYTSLAVAPDLPERRPEAIRRLLRALERAIGWMRMHPREAMQVATTELNVEGAVVEETWPRLGFNLAVDQGFVMLLQSEAQWAIASGFTPGRTVPDFPAMIDAAILARLRPGSVTITRQP